MDALKQWFANKTALACLTAIALVAGGFVLAPTSSSAATTPVIAVADTTWDDGLNHYILTPSAAGLAPVAREVLAGESPARPSSAEGPSGRGPSGVVPGSIPPDAIATRTPEGKTLWLLKDGTFVDDSGVPVSSNTATPTTTHAAPATDTHTASVTPTEVLTGGSSGLAASKTFADVVRQWPGVESVKEMNGGLVAIATSLTRDNFENRKEVARVDADQLLQLGSIANGSPNDPLFASEWMLDNTGLSSQVGGSNAGTLGADTRAPKAWSKATGQGVVVADIDSGVQLSHPDLTQQLWHNTNETSCSNGIDDDSNGYVDDCNGWDAGSNDNNPNPDVSGSFGAHGTHVAGIIGAKTDNGAGIAGMAPNVRIMPVKIASGNQLATSSILSAVMYAVDNGAKIINASWGSNPGTPRNQAYIMEQAVQYARARNVLFVVAAGNSNTNIDTSPSWPANFSLYYDNVLTVGASTNADTRASFSNYGASAVGIFAPGWFINSTVPGGGYSMMSGTSMAAPCVVGAAALVAETQPSGTPSQWITRLKSSVDVIPALAGLSQSSRLNAAVAVGAASDPMTVDYQGFTQWMPDKTYAGSATVHINDASLVQAGDQIRATLITPDAGYLWAVSEAQIGAGIGSAMATATTDSNGNAVLATLSASAISNAASANGLDLTLGMSLPEGDYGMLLQVTDSNATPRMNGSAVYFNVSRENDPSKATTTTTAASNGGGAPTTTSTTAANGSVTTTSITAAPGTTTTAAPGATTTTAAPGATSTSTTTAGSAPTTTARPNSTTTTTSRAATTTTARANPTTTTPSGGGSPTTTTTTPSGGGSSATTTTVASGGSSGGGSTPISIPSGGGSSGGGSPSTPTPAPVSSGGWTIGNRYPASGSDVGGTMVMISGVFPNPSNATISLGGNAATIFHTSSQTIWFLTPAHAPGLVNLTLSAPGVSLTMTNAFTYLSTSGNAGGGSGGSGGGSSGGSGGGSSGGGNTGGSSGVTTTTAASGSGNTPTTIVAPRYRGTLTLNRLPSTHTWGSFSATAWPARNCLAQDCNGIAVR